MKLIIGLLLILTGTAYGQIIPVIEPQVDVIPPRDSSITVQRTAAPYTILLTNNTTHDITGLVVEWAAGGPPQTLLLGHYGFKEAVVPAKGMVVLTPPADINSIPLGADRSGRRIVGPAAPPAVSRVVISVPTVLFDDGTMIGNDRYELVRTIGDRTELPAALAAAEAKWAMKKPDIYEFTYKRICFCPPPPPGKPGSEPIVFRVISGAGLLLPPWSDNPTARQNLDKFSTVEKQFEFIRQELEKRPYKAEVNYDPDDGHPTRAYIDPLKNTADEEYGFTVTGFTPLDPKR